MAAARNLYVIFGCKAMSNEPCEFFSRRHHNY